MIEDIINYSLDILKIQPYEETILTKIKYNFKLSEIEKFDFFVLKWKLGLISLIKDRGIK